MFVFVKTMVPSYNYFTLNICLFSTGNYQILTPSSYTDAMIGFFMQIKEKKMLWLLTCL